MGYVVNASSEEGRVAVNGMSNYKRDSHNANSAIDINIAIARTIYFALDPVIGTGITYTSTTFTHTMDSNS